MEPKRKERDFVEHREGTTDLMRASASGDAREVERLLGEGADIDAVDLHGWSSLMWAARQWRRQVLELLLSRGASVDARTRAGWTALTWTARDSCPELMELLLKFGSDAAHVVPSGIHAGLTPLHFVALGDEGTEGDKVSCARLLIGAGALSKLDALGVSYAALLVKSSFEEGHQALGIEILDGLPFEAWEPALRDLPDLTASAGYAAWFDRVNLRHVLPDGAASLDGRSPSLRI